MPEEDDYPPPPGSGGRGSNTYPVLLNEAIDGCKSVEEFMSELQNNRELRKQTIKYLRYLDLENELFR